MIWPVLLLLGCIVAEVTRELCFKTASGPLDWAVASRNWRAAFANRLLWVGLSIWALETLAWLAVLQKIPLGIAYPVTAASYAVAPLMGWLLLKERLSPSQVAGVLLVTGGALCVGLSGS
jgi:undecaprenyl phosphate-alpha-L-ara4N flippase subunit ArnE